MNDLPYRQNPRTSLAVFMYTFKFLAPFFVFFAVIGGGGLFAYGVIEAPNPDWRLFVFFVALIFPVFPAAIATSVQLINWTYQWCAYLAGQTKENDNR